LVYVKAGEEVDFFLLFGIRSDARGFYAVTYNVGLRFPLLRPLVAGSAGDGIHINIPGHFLSRSQDRAFQEWRFSDEPQLGAIAPILMEAMQSSIMPFTRDNTTLMAFRSHLSSESPSAWWALDPHQRIVLLAALHWALGCKADALKTLDEALSSSACKWGQRRHDLHSLKGKILSIEDKQEKEM
jgi:hypothetical protein